MKILENLIEFSDWKILEAINASPLPDSKKSIKVDLDDAVKGEIMSGKKIKDDKVKIIQDLAIKNGKIKKEDLDKKTILYKSDKNDKGEEELILTVSKKVKGDEKGVMSFEELKELISNSNLKGKIKIIDKKT
jgi:hypothetical protein